MSHRFHPTDQDPSGAIMYDDCPRCAEQAANPLNCDPDRIAALWQRMVTVEHTDNGTDHYPTSNEAKACRYLYGVAVLIERVSRINPWTWPWTLDGQSVAKSPTVYAGFLDVPYRDDERDRR